MSLPVHSQETKFLARRNGDAGIMGKLYVKGFSRKDKRVKELGATAFWQLPPNVCQTKFLMRSGDRQLFGKEMKEWSMAFFINAFPELMV